VARDEGSGEVRSGASSSVIQGEGDGYLVGARRLSGKVGNTIKVEGLKPGAWGGERYPVTAGMSGDDGPGDGGRRTCSSVVWHGARD
jgi:hypothetical protein